MKKPVSKKYRIMYTEKIGKVYTPSMIEDRFNGWDEEGYEFVGSIGKNDEGIMSVFKKRNDNTKVLCDIMDKEIEKGKKKLNRR